jgi:hypothetical protein
MQNEEVTFDLSASATFAKASELNGSCAIPGAPALSGRPFDTRSPHSARSNHTALIDPYHQYEYSIFAVGDFAPRIIHGQRCDRHPYSYRPGDVSPLCGIRGQCSLPRVEPHCRHRNVMIHGKLSRTMTEECWDVDRRKQCSAPALHARYFRPCRSCCLTGSRTATLWRWGVTLTMSLPR